MLRTEAEVIAVSGAVATLMVLLLKKHFTLVCFDEGYAAALGVNIRTVDLVMMGLVLAVTVIGLRIVGLVLIVALMIIPPVAACFGPSGPTAWFSSRQASGGLGLYRRGASSAGRACRPAP